MPDASEPPGMPLDQAANFVAEELTSAVDSSTTTFPVGDASVYPDPANGEYNVAVWDATSYETAADDPDAEVVRVTGRDTGADTLTVTRGQEGTTAAAHGAGSRVPVALTAKMIGDIETELNNAAISVSDDGTVVLTSAADLNFGSNVSITDDGDNTVTIDATDTRINVEDSGATKSSNTQGVNFDTNLAVTNDGDGSVTVDATDTDTTTNISDDGTQVVADTDDINFATSLTVTDDADGSVTVDGTDTRTDVSDDGTQVVADTDDINFAANLTVTDDGDGSVSVDASGGSSGAIALEEYATAEDVPAASEVSQPTIAYVADVGDGTDDYIGVFNS